MDEKIEQVNKHVENISLQTCMVEEGDIPVMGEILNSLSELEKYAGNFDSLAFSNVIAGLQNYINRLILEEDDDVKPLEEGVMTLTAIWRDTSRGKEFSFDITGVLEDLGFKPDDESQSPDVTEYEPDIETNIEEKKELSDEDIQILGDFIIEARESLETIELKLIELEHQPDDKEIINAIVRKPQKPNETICFNVPGDSIDGSVSTVFHKSVIKNHLRSMGYRPITINEGLSVVLSELSESNYTGIGISIGGGMCNVCFAYLSVPVVTFSLQKGGDYIDDMVSESVGEPKVNVRGVKENGFDLSTEPNGKIETAYVRRDTG